MTTKDLFRKQIIIPIGTNNVERVIVQSNAHVANINKLFKDIKYEISADMIHLNNKRIIITTNKNVISSDLNIVEEYMKKLNDVNVSDIMSPRLPQLKLYLKILSISYFVESTNLSVTSDIIERVIKISYIFDDTVLAF